MNKFVITRLLSAHPLPDAQGGAIELETHEGPIELRFTFEDAGRLIADLEIARERIREQHAHAGMPIAEKPKLARRWDTAVDPVNQVAVLRAHFDDGTAQELRIARSDVARIAQFLQKALKRMEPGADMRQ